MKLKIEKTWGMEILLHFETYLGTALFFFITAILTVQVIGRFIFSTSFAWIEEVSIICFVLMTYCGVSGAILTRQNIKIDMVLNMVPFGVKKVLLIFNTLIHAGFTGWLTYYLFSIMSNMLKSKSVYSVTRFPKVYVYYAIAALLILSMIRGVIEVFRLSKEDMQKLGKAKPAFDLDAIWKQGVEARDKFYAEHPDLVKEKKKKEGKKK